MKKLLFVCGGISGEHEISLISTKHVLKSIDRSRFEFDVLYIDKSGAMGMTTEDALNQLPDNPQEFKSSIENEAVSFRPYSKSDQGPCFFSEAGDKVYGGYELVFPILHGVGGEDGRIQGFFETASLPVVGCGLKASAICMDKILTKKICRSAGLPVVQFEELRRSERDRNLNPSYPCFVKPASAGSSLGVVKVESEGALAEAIDEAFRWDDRLLVEPAIEGRELEVAVLQLESGPMASPAGEIRCSSGFYSYEAKYVDSDSVELLAPADLAAEQTELLQKLSIEVFEALECEGMARIDFFLSQDGEFLLNEVNTIPGFTPISMYPRLMGLAGISYPELITRLIEGALRKQIAGH